MTEIAISPNSESDLRSNDDAPETWQPYIPAIKKEEASSHIAEDLLAANHVNKAFDRNTWEILVALARTVDASSPWTANHSKRVTGLATAIGRSMGLSLEQLGTLCCAALLHDIGKVGVSTNILDKPGKLTSNEFECMEEHPAKGARILEPLSTYAPVVPIVLQHHERLDGTGYPNSLTGETICTGARILAVADVYDALVSERPYRTSWNRERAVDFIKEGKRTLFDSQIVEAFLDIVAKDVEKTNPDTTDSSEILLDVSPSSRSLGLFNPHQERPDI